jgi:Flp pilus assembly protein TadG
MKSLVHSLRPKRQDGSVAVEAALIISLILIPLIAFILLFGRYFWYYGMAQKAVHDAALVMARAPIADIRSKAASALAQSIIELETADMDDATRSTIDPTKECYYDFSSDSQPPTSFSCASPATPVIVRTSIFITVADPLLGPITESVLGGAALPIIVHSSVRYVGH